METDANESKRQIRYECGMALYDEPGPVSEFPSKEEIDADLRKRSKELFPEKPDGYVPSTLEVIQRLLELQKKAGVSIGP